MPKRILFADDDADFRQVTADLLRLHGHEVHEVANGREAVEAVVRNHPDVALLDAQMPICSGAQAATEIRANPSTHAIRIVMMTSLPEADLSASFASYDAYVRKGSGVERILRSLE